jgi:hypothetical protein
MLSNAQQRSATLSNSLSNAFYGAAVAEQLLEMSKRRVNSLGSDRGRTPPGKELKYYQLSANMKELELVELKG